VEEEVMNLLQFASAMGVAQAEIQHGREKAVEDACKLIEQTAKDAMGTYTFGWPPLAASTVERKATGDSPLLETGELQNSIEHRVEHSGNRSDGFIGTDDDKAEWMEVGTSKIPPRPFMGGALEHVANDLPEIFGRTVVKALKGGD
jgi:HK97 gp10 family phage protein